MLLYGQRPNERDKLKDHIDLDKEFCLDNPVRGLIGSSQSKSVDFHGDFHRVHKVENKQETHQNRLSWKGLLVYVPLYTIVLERGKKD